MIYDKNHPLRVCTLCSGYDSQCLALKYLKDKHSEFDFDLVAWSEIDKSAITAHNVLFPEYKDRNLGDMSKIMWDGVKDFDAHILYTLPVGFYCRNEKRHRGRQRNKIIFAMVYTECHHS